MNCKEAEKLILPYIRNELPDELTAPFIAHVRSCSECYDEFEIYYTIRHMLQSDDAGRSEENGPGQEESYDIRQMIEADFENRLLEIRKKKRRKTAAYIGIAGGILLLTALVLAALFPDETVRLFFNVLEFLTDWRMQQG